MRIPVGWIAVAGLWSACHGTALGTGSSTDAGAADLSLLAAGDLGACRVDKFKFAGCANDGSVEFCAPQSFSPTLTSLVPSLTCAPGGGRAGCYNSPGLFLCTYPTIVPRECLTLHGDLTPVALQELCALAAFDAVTEIVATIVP